MVGEDTSEPDNTGEQRIGIDIEANANFFVIE
jgi:hypothetical protein